MENDFTNILKDNKFNILSVIKDFTDKVIMFIKRLVKYIPLLWNTENDFNGILETIKVELQILNSSEEEINKDLSIIINHIERYQNIYNYINKPKEDTLNILYSSENTIDKEIQQLEYFHLESLFSRLFKIFKKDKVNTEQWTTDDL